MVMAEVSESAHIRGRLDHPVVDGDGHVVEYMPLVREYLREEGGDNIATFFDRDSKWYSISEQERRDRRSTRPPWWGIPTKLTIDNATAVLPRLLRSRMGEMGLDFTVLYATRGLTVHHLPQEDVRRAACRAFNRYLWDVFGPYREVMTPAAIIPMHTPAEAIEELEFAVGLGFKAVMMAGHVQRPIPAAAGNDARLGRYAFYIDNLVIDSAYDYDPVWRKCVELKVSPTFHSAGMGWGSRTTPSNYMYNHIGHFASASELLCKALFMGGVTRRFPELRFGFLEAGVGWATNLFADLVGHWEKRNASKMSNYDPRNLDQGLFEQLFMEYADELLLSKVDEIGDAYDRLGPDLQDRSRLDDFASMGIERAEDIRDLFVPNFFFGCEADDPINAWAFNDKANPFGARLKAMFSSDIGHWDVPDMREVLEEAFELVEHDLITEADFRDFVFTNAVELLTGLNKDFFKGTVVESEAAKIITQQDPQPAN
jgi:predicted TIM-barrel fold metal-dependent hydrolase